MQRYTVRSLFLLFSISLFLLPSFSKTLSQVKDYRLGKPFDERNMQKGAYYDYSQPDQVNIDVSLWGGVQFAGRYTVPITTTVLDLLSLAGGPQEKSLLEDIRIYRKDADSSHLMIKFSYNDLMWEENLRFSENTIPDLKAGDVIIIPVAPRFYWKDWLSLGLTVLSAALSLAVFIYNVTK